MSEADELDEASGAAADGRSLCVNCHEEEEHKLSFFLKFVEPEGGWTGVPSIAAITKLLVAHP